MSDFFPVFITACLANNLILEYLVGVELTLAVSGKVEAALDLTLCLLVIVPAVALSVFLVNTHIIGSSDLQHLQLFSLVASIIIVCTATDMLLARFNPAIHGRIKGFLPLLLLNSTLLGVALLSIGQNTGLLLTLVYSFGLAAGFGLVVLMLVGMNERIRTADIPAAFQGPAIYILNFGILAMAFSGFRGIG